MNGSVTSAFDELEDFGAAIRAEGWLNLLITGRGRFHARLTQVTLHSLRLSATEEHLARIAFLTVPADMALITLPVDGAPLPVYGGIAIRDGEIIILSPGEQTHARTGGFSRVGTI